MTDPTGGYNAFILTFSEAYYFFAQLPFLGSSCSDATWYSLHFAWWLLQLCCSYPEPGGYQNKSG